MFVCVGGPDDVACRTSHHAVFKYVDEHRFQPIELVICRMLSRRKFMRHHAVHSQNERANQPEPQYGEAARSTVPLAHQVVSQGREE